MIDRLTQDGVDYCRSCGAESCAARGGGIDIRCPDYKRYEKLRAYEKAGWTPDQIHDGNSLIAEAIRANDRLTGRRIHELLTAEAEGRLLVLPCKIGTPIYWINFNQHDGYWIETSQFTLGDFYVFGKSVFLTREEAEAALRKETDNG